MGSPQDYSNGRFAGSRDERRAGDFLLERMGAAGLQGVHAESFRFLAWERRRRPTLQVVSPVKLTLECIALPYSPATRKGGLELELINLGGGLPEDFARARRF